MHRRYSIRDGTNGLEEAALVGEDVLHVPVERGGHAHEAHGLGRGGGVEHNDVVALFAPVLVDVHHGAEFFHAGQDGEFLGLYAADTGGAEQGDDPGGDLFPVALDFLLDVELEDGEAVGDGEGVGGLRVEQVGLEVEGIGQAVRRVDAHHQRSAAHLRQLDAGRRSQAGLSHASLAAIEEDPHTLIVEGCAGWGRRFHLPAQISPTL